MPAKKKRSTKETVDKLKEAAADVDNPADVSLTIKMEKFIVAYLETGNASEAYRRAYNAENMAPETIHVKACELLKHGKVSVRLTAIRQKAEEAAVLDRAWVLKRLMRNARIAMGEESVQLKMKMGDADKAVEVEVSDRNGAIANKALELLGKTPELAMFIDRKEIGDPGDFKGKTDEELEAQAAEMAEKLGLTKSRRVNGNGTSTH